MTKKDYIIIAGVINNLIQQYNGSLQLPRPAKLEAIKELVKDLIPQLQYDNPKFEASKFTSACGIEW